MRRTPTRLRPRRLSAALVLLAALVAGRARAGAPPTRPTSPADVWRRAVERPGTQRIAESALPPSPAAGQAQAPYLVVLDEASRGERLPLEETRGEVTIAGPIAAVQVTQVFRNRGDRPIEARYVFPASTRAAVHGMRLRIGERTIEARIDRRAQAAHAYAAARASGQRAALLDEERPNVFTVRVANIMPGDRIVAELDYSELVVPEEGVYELVYPTVVGPRYAGGADPAQDGWIANPTLHAGEPAPYRFAFTAHLASAVPVAELSSPSHALRVSWSGPREADVALAGEGGGDRDVVLRWRLAGAAVQAGALAYQPEGGEGWFLAAVEPPARVPPEDVPPRELVFVLDVSGSMHGYPLDTAKALMRDLLPRLRPQDRFNVVFFSGASWVFSPSGSLPGTPEHVRAALDAFAHHAGGGGTELLAALRVAYGLPRPDDRMARAVVVVTDGYVAVEPGAFRLVRTHLGEASCFAFGIGTGVNRGLIEALARAGEGEATVVTRPEEAPAAAARLARVMSAPVLTHLRARVESLDAADLLPAHLPDLLAERPVVLLARFHGAPRGRLILEGESAHGPFRRVVELSPAQADPAHAPLRALWARRWVSLLMDEQHLDPTPEIEEAVTSLGLAHHLLTPFTSFVAIDSEVVNHGAPPEEVAQPLPMPGGVSDLAVGEAEAAAAPMPWRAKVMELRREAPADGVAQGAPRSGPATPRAQERATEPPASPRAEAQAHRDSTLTVVSVESTRLTHPEALTAAIVQRLRERAITAGAYTVEVTLDARGCVREVRVLTSPTPSTVPAIRSALAGLRSAARPGAGMTYRIVLRVT